MSGSFLKNRYRQRIVRCLIRVYVASFYDKRLFSDRIGHKNITTLLSEKKVFFSLVSDFI